jgi:OOP family OmpA-OmpF porin
MPKQTLTIASFISVGFIPLAHAVDQTPDDRWYIAPFASFVQTGGDRRADQGWGGGMGIGKIIDRHFNVEIKGFYDGFNGHNGTWSLTGGTADLQYYFSRDTFSPYAVVAAGGMNSCVGSNCGAGIIGEAGLGFTYELNDNFLLRSDVRYRYNNNLNNHVQAGTDQFNDMTVNVGFVIPFGEKPKQVAKADIRPEPIVTAPAPVAKPVDPCHGRHYKSSKVDANGCPIKIVLKGEHFKYDSAELLPPAKEILDGLATDLINDPQKTEVEARGYASSEGGVAYNMRLSERRASSVINYLKSKGVTNKLISKGFGIENPIADNSTEAGRSENRRVELIWIEN